jgi:GAF domain-containing protein
MLTAAQIEQRLTILQSSGILDTPPEEQFDDLTRVASFICKTPISLISLLDEKRQWFKSRVGLDATETPIEQAFCLHAIEKPEVMVIRDAWEDGRFAANPLVTGAPNIRFYAGAPIITKEGVALGTLCAIDRRPRDLEPEALIVLQALARQAATLLELRNLVDAYHHALVMKDHAEREAEELRKLLPMCSYCRDVRDDNDYWQHLDGYLTSHAHVDLSHTVCPKCMPRARRDLQIAPRPAVAV